MNFATICDIHMWSMERDGLKLIEVLQDLEVIPKEFECPKGHGPMALVIKQDCFWWRCSDYSVVLKKKQKRVRCDFMQSVRKDTFFHNSKLTIRQICMFVNLWLDNASLKLIGKQCGIISNNARTDWASFCREVLFDKVLIDIKPIGGAGKVVEIDESKFGKRKYHRGHHVEGQWVFGGIERDSGECFMVPVERRDKETLLPIIKNWILPGTTIMSDCWKAYDCLTDEGYMHQKVNHSIEFVDSQSGACTNRIEASWNAAKRTIEASGRRKQFYHGYLSKYMFQKRCQLQKLDQFKEFMKAAGKLYDPKKPVSLLVNPETDPSSESDAEEEE